MSQSYNFHHVWYWLPVDILSMSKSQSPGAGQGFLLCSALVSPADAASKAAVSSAPTGRPGLPVYCHVDVLAARNLPPADPDGLADPCYEVRVEEMTLKLEEMLRFVVIFLLIQTQSRLRASSSTSSARIWSGACQTYLEPHFLTPLGVGTFVTSRRWRGEAGESLGDVASCPNWHQWQRWCFGQIWLWSSRQGMGWMTDRTDMGSSRWQFFLGQGKIGLHFCEINCEASDCCAAFWVATYTSHNTSQHYKWMRYGLCMSKLSFWDSGLIV